MRPGWQLVAEIGQGALDSVNAFAAFRGFEDAAPPRTVLGSPVETSTSASTGLASMPTSANVFSLGEHTSLRNDTFTEDRL